MDRRNFLKTLVGGVALAGAVRTWPFRVYSFSSEVVVKPTPAEIIGLHIEHIRDQIPKMFEIDSAFAQYLGLSRAIYPGKLKGSGSSWTPSLKDEKFQIG